MRGGSVGVFAGVALATLLAVAAAEAAFRVRAYGWSPRALDRWADARPWDRIRELGPAGIKRPVPNGEAEWRLHPWHAPVEYRLDRNGFRIGRGRGIVPAAAPACRVLALGDSHTFGYGVMAEQTWPSMLGMMLPGVATTNAGICGTSIAASQEWLPDALAATRPQVVVIAVSPWSLRDDPEPPEIHPIDGRWPRLQTYLGRAAKWSAVADRATDATLRWSAVTLGWPPPAPVLWELDPLVEPLRKFHARWRGVHARLADMVASIRDAGATPLVLFVPLDVQVSRARNALYRDGRLPYRTHGFVDRDYTRDDRYERALRKTTARLRVPFVDATSALRLLSPGGFLADDYHLAPDGHAYVAAAVAGSVAAACTGPPPAIQVRGIGAPAT